MRYCAMRRHFVIPQEGGGSKCKCRNQYLSLSLPVILYTIVASSSTSSTTTSTIILSKHGKNAKAIKHH
jgi:hypothetical protein